MSGWNMPISLSRKLAAMKLVKFPTLDFRVYRVGLRPDQVKLMDLPQEPLKPKDKRGPRWELATGTKATEIDALITRQPDVLREMATDAIDNFFDRTLVRRNAQAHRAWAEKVRDLIDRRDDLAEVRQRVSQRYAEISGDLADTAAEIQRLSLEVTKGIELPPLPTLAQPKIKADQPWPLVDSRWSFRNQTLSLKESAKYVQDDEEDDGV